MSAVVLFTDAAVMNAAVNTVAVCTGECCCFVY